MLPSVWFLSAPGSDLKGKGREFHISNAVVVDSPALLALLAVHLPSLLPTSLVWRGVVLGTV